MPQGNSAAPGWFVKVVNEVIKGLANVAAYLDDVIVFDSDPSAYVITITGLFKQLRKHSLKLSLLKAKIGATDADFFGHTISPAGIRLNASKVAVLTKMPMPSDLRQLRSILGGLSYYRKILGDMAKRIRPITSLLKQGVKFVFTPPMESIVRTLLEELSAPLVLVSDWDAVADNSRPFLLYCDASVDGFGATLEHEQKDGSIRPIVFISRATLESESHWTPLDLESGSIVWSVKRLRGYLWASSRTTRPSRASPRLLSATPESKDGSNSSRYTTILWSTAKAAPTVTPTFCLGYRCLRRRMTAAATAA